MIPGIEKRPGVAFSYVPVLLGGVFKATGNVSPAVSLRGIKNKPEYEALELRRFIARHGIERFASNSHFPVNTLQIMRGAVAARHLDCFPRYVDEVYRHMWADPTKADFRGAEGRIALPTRYRRAPHCARGGVTC